MAAARVRQAACRLASTAAASASAGSTGRTAAGLGTKLVVVTAAAALAYDGTQKQLMERVPYGPDGGRERGPKSLWAAWLGGWRAQRLGPATTTDLDQHGYSEVLHQLGPAGLQRLRAGEVKVHWLRPVDSAVPEDNLVYQAPFRQAVEESMQAVVAALRQEAEAKQFGQRVLDQGFHLIITPDKCVDAASLPSDALVVSAGMLTACLSSSGSREPRSFATAMAALQYVLAHELAHLYLTHGEERQLFSAMLAGTERWNGWIQQIRVLSGLADRMDSNPGAHKCSSESYLQRASVLKEHSWQLECEADECACAVMARLRLPPEQWAAGLQMLATLKASEHEAGLQWLVTLQQRLPPEQKRQLAAELGFPGDDLDAGVALCKAALQSGSVDAMDQLGGLFLAIKVQRQLLTLAQGSTTEGAHPNSQGAVQVGRTRVPPDVAAGPNACPKAALPAFLADLADTHPPYHARLARINQLSSQLPSLMRATAPPTAVGGRYSHMSVAEQVAERLAARLRAEAAAKEAAAKRSAADQSAVAGAFGGNSGAAAGAVALGLAAAAALLTVAVN